MDEELGGRMGAAQILGRGVRESPLLRQGFGFTMLLAIIGAAGRVVIPIVVQQAIDHGFVRDSVNMRVIAVLATVSSATIVAIGAVLDVAAQYGDPTRALHAIITGIGFLGAGLIFTDKHSSGIQGVTTAATVFSTAAVGVAVGLGFQVVGAGLTVVILVILRSTQVLEKSINRNA